MASVICVYGGGGNKVWKSARVNGPYVRPTQFDFPASVFDSVGQNFRPEVNGTGKSLSSSLESTSRWWKFGSKFKMGAKVDKKCIYSVSCIF